MNPENLTNFKPGQSGNPNGRPKGAKTGLRARLIQELAKDGDSDILAKMEKLGIKLNDNDVAAVIAHVVARKAQRGDMNAVKLIADQTELPHPKDVKLTGDFVVNMPAIDADCL
jgi:urease gamma subunit